MPVPLIVTILTLRKNMMYKISNVIVWLGFCIRNCLITFVFNIQKSDMSECLAHLDENLEAMMLIRKSDATYWCVLRSLDRCHVGVKDLIVMKLCMD